MTVNSDSSSKAVDNAVNELKGMVKVSVNELN